MSTISDQASIGGIARTSQIIVGALIASVLVFLAIAFLVDLGQTAPAPAGAGAGGGEVHGNAADAKANANARAAANPDAFDTMITYLAVAFGVVALPLSFIVPALVANQNRRAIAAGTWAHQASGGVTAHQIIPEAIKTDAAKLAMVYPTQLIIGGALNEGAAFFAGVAYMIGKDPIALGLAFLLLGGLVVRFPTTGRVQLWIDQQQEKLILERQAAN
jgi:hypothetical protein